MEAILAIGGIWLFFFLVRIAFRSLGAATKATVNITPNLSADVISAIFLGILNI